VLADHLKLRIKRGLFVTYQGDGLEAVLTDSQEGVQIVLLCADQNHLRRALRAQRFQCIRQLLGATISWNNDSHSASRSQDVARVTGRMRVQRIPRLRGASVRSERRRPVRNLQQV